MADSLQENVKIKFPKSSSPGISNFEVTNILIYKALNKMEYFRIRCLEMEEKHGLDFRRFKERIDRGEGIFEEWDELALWEEYFSSFEEWKSKYEEINRFLK
ncbi:MAG: hypothetical protein KAT34_15725 [Candidatus Aminicenantes bacterium]|jgi:hypothetical protein|nr:hypothetical protein [Candidatus Aminicenantes bacterium]